MREWLAPDPCIVLEAVADVRLGGAYRIVVRDPLGNTHTTTGEYRELVPNRRLVKTWVYEGPFHKDRYPTLLTVDFRETNPRSTEITLRQDQLLTDGRSRGQPRGLASLLRQARQRARTSEVMTVELPTRLSSVDGSKSA